MMANLRKDDFSGQMPLLHDASLRSIYGPLYMSTYAGFFNFMNTNPLVKKVPGFVHFALHRYFVRLFPPIFVAIMLSSVYHEYFGDQFKRKFGVNDACDRTMWQTLLMVSNFNRVPDIVSDRVQSRIC